MLALVAPLAANAGPLLSGYGGPGQGNQAILGSTLIGGSGGAGGSGGSRGSGGGATEGAASATTSTAGSAQTGAATTRTSTTGGSLGRGAHPGSAIGTAARPIDGELRDRSYPGLESGEGSTALGLSAADIVYIVLAAAALASAGLLTRRLAGARTAKGHS